MGAEDTASNIDEQRDSASGTELKQGQIFRQIRPHRSAFFLYCFKPPFPSDGGFAAASAGRRRTSPFRLTNLAHRFRLELEGSSKAHPGRPLDSRPSPL